MQINFIENEINFQNDKTAYKLNLNILCLRALMSIFEVFLIGKQEIYNEKNVPAEQQEEEEQARL